MNGSQIRARREVIEGKKPWSGPERHLLVTVPKKNGKATLDLRDYNGFGQLVQIYRDGQRIHFTYRPDNMRHNKEVTYPFKPALNRKTTHFWDGQNIVLETNTSGEIKAVYLRGIQLIAQQIGEEKFYYLHNAHGDVVQRIADNGISAPQYKYDAFGNEKKPKDIDPNPFRYCGEYFDFETGEYYLRARNYDPSTGRFTSADTHWNPSNMIYGDNPTKINEKQDSQNQNITVLLPSILDIRQSGNLYGYCLANPLSYGDSSGQFLLALAATALVAGLVSGVVSGIIGGITNSADGGDFGAGFAGGFAGGFVGGFAGGFVGGFAGGFATALLTPFIGPVLANTVGGAAGGYVSSYATDHANNKWSPDLPQKSDEDIRVDAGKAALFGLGVGFLMGIIDAGVEDADDPKGFITDKGIMPTYTTGFGKVLKNVFAILGQVFEWALGK